MSPLPPRTIRLLALCGMAAPLLFGLTVAIAGYLRPGYSHSTQVMSELGETGAPYAIVMNIAGLAGTGLLMILFSLGLREGLGRGRAVTAGSLLVAGAGAAYVAMAFFSCDRGCVPVTAAGELHMLLGVAATVIALVSAFVFAFALKGVDGWGGYWQYSMVTGFLVLGTLPVFASAQGSAGLWQRVLVGIIFLWEEVMALRLYLLAGSPRLPPGPAR